MVVHKVYMMYIGVQMEYMAVYNMYIGVYKVYMAV